MQTIFRLTLTIALIAVFTGCSKRQACPTGFTGQNCEQTINKKLLRPYYPRVTPIIENEYDEALVIKDMGVDLFVWIAPYRAKDRALHGASTVVIEIKDADYIIGEELPKRTKYNGLTTADGRFPFEYTQSETEHYKVSPEGYKTYINNINENNLKKNDETTSKELDDKILSIINEDEEQDDKTSEEK
jgi:hypothetical protein